MIRVWLFLHFLGTAGWIGGVLASMIVRLTDRDAPGAGSAAVVRGQARVHNRLIAPGAVLVVISGLVLTLRLYGPATGRPPGLWLLGMQALGLIGGLLVLFVGVPTAARLGRLARAGDQSPAFDRLGRRQAMVDSIAGTLALVGLATVLFR